jgi:uncharacterized protein (TIGR03435 family)
VASVRATLRATSDPTMHSRIITVFLTSGLWSAAVLAQASPAFEVATVKSSPAPEGDSININLGTVRNGQLTLTNASLSDCIRFAYGLVSDAQIAGPDWVKSKAVRFDIVAKAPPDTPRDQFPFMLRPLLAERLKLAFHYEPREMSFLALVVGKNGPKVQPAKSTAPVPGGLQVAGRIASPQMSMQQLVTLLSRFQRQTVRDLTGLQGLYELKLEWTPDSNRAVPPGDDPNENRTAAANPSAPSLFTAVQEQLGLRLEPRKGPLDVLVVDHAEQIPTEN